MEVHRQQCQVCGSRIMNNILVRESGKRQAVFARCANCGKLVARYMLTAYYHHGRGYDSFLRSMGADERQSAKGLIGVYEKVNQDAETGFAAALDVLAREGKGFT